MNACHQSGMVNINLPGFGWEIWMFLVEQYLKTLHIVQNPFPLCCFLSHTKAKTPPNSGLFSSSLVSYLKWASSILNCYWNLLPGLCPPWNPLFRQGELLKCTSDRGLPDLSLSRLWLFNPWTQPPWPGTLQPPPHRLSHLELCVTAAMVFSRSCCCGLCTAVLSDKDPLSPPPFHQWIPIRLSVTSQLKSHLFREAFPHPQTESNPPGRGFQSLACLSFSAMITLWLYIYLGDYWRMSTSFITL